MEVAREKIEKWRMNCNEFRPHSSLGDLTPRQAFDKYKNRIAGRTQYLNLIEIKIREWQQ
jgi:transposase InsO family protein